MNSFEGKKLLPAKEAAAFLRISLQTLYNLKCQGKIRGFNMGGAKKGKLYFLENELVALVMGKAI